MGAKIQAARANVKSRIVGGKLTSILGTIGGAAVLGAAKYFDASGGNISSWKPYAGAAAVAVAGLLMKR